MPLCELAASPRCAGLNSVLRHVGRDEDVKIFIGDVADAKILAKVQVAFKEKEIPVERAEDSQQLGRACALTRKTAVAAILKE